MVDAIVLSKLRYAISVYHGFLSAELEGQINAFLKRAFKYGFCTSVHTIDVIAEAADRSLFAKMAGSQHCLHTLFPDIKPLYSCRLRPKGHAYKLPECCRDLYKKSFVPRCLISCYGS